MLRLKQLQHKSQATAVATPPPVAASSVSATSTDSAPVAAAPADGTTAQPENVFTVKKTGTGGGSKRKNAGQVRLQKDLGELDKIPGTELVFPDPDNVMQFNLIVVPQEGMYRNARYEFDVKVPASYPFDPPKVTCKIQIYHPNINWEGNVCLNILREDWKPVLSISAVIFGIYTLFVEPNPSDPLNPEAADHMLKNRQDFEQAVKATLRGGQHYGHQFPRLV